MAEIDLTPAELAKLREMAEDMVEWQDAMEPILKGDIAGRATCPSCSGTIRWNRQGRDWDMKCEECGWNACGSFGNVSN